MRKVREVLAQVRHGVEAGCHRFTLAAGGEFAAGRALDQLARVDPQSLREPSQHRNGCGRKKGWTRGENPSDPIRELDAAMPALTGDPMKRLDSLPELDTKDDREAQWRSGVGDGLAVGRKVMNALNALDDSMIVANAFGVAELMGKGFEVQGQADRHGPSPSDTSGRAEVERGA